MACNVFEEDPFGGALSDDARDVWPKVAGIIGTGPLSGRAEWLAGISGEDNVKGAAEDPGIETAQVVPDWCRGEISRALGRDEDVSGVSLPLDQGPGVIAGLGEHDAQIQASAACAEGQSMPGT